MSDKQVNSRKTNKLNFGQALEFLKLGFPLARSSWVDMCWVMIPNPPKQIMYAFTARLNAGIAQMNAGYAELDPFFILKKNQCEFNVGWLPCIDDLLANDWFIYDKDLTWKRLPDTHTAFHS